MADKHKKVSIQAPASPVSPPSHGLAGKSGSSSGSSRSATGVGLRPKGPDRPSKKTAQKFEAAAPKKIDYFPSPGEGVKQLDVSGGYEASADRIQKLLRSSQQLTGGRKSISEKIILVGDSGVGKTSLIIRLCRDKFTEDFQPTIGVDFMAEKFEIFEQVISLHLWDTAGQDRFRSLSTPYYRNAAAVLLSFDLSNEESLEGTLKWYEEVKTNIPDTTNVSLFLVGLKCDVTQRAVALDKAISHAKDLKAEYFECSSKENRNVKELFARIAFVMFEKALIKAAVTQEKQGASTADLSAATPGGQKKKEKCLIL
eukprot:GFYU01003098.1.p1 GENE.GFYU01003098.1~~GFYU01003098.1.p1  ORF type:complete len:313 (-),score=52.79 GFYU01003098.1:173-1111(-)